MKHALLVVSFGTSFHDTLTKNIVAIEQALATANPDKTLFRAFTSGMIMKKLRQRDGIDIPDVAQALTQILEQGYTAVTIQPTHIINGDEFDKLCALAGQFKSQFAQFAIGAPLLTEIDDYHSVANALLSRLPEKTDDTSIVYMGHGSTHHANSVYAMLEYMLHDMGRTDIHIGTVEGYPALPQVSSRVKARGTVQKIVLLPFMIVAGDHATNDLAGEDEDSWNSILTAEGYQTTCILEGLGENPAIRALFVAHAKQAQEALNA